MGACGEHGWRLRGEEAGCGCYEAVIVGVGERWSLPWRADERALWVWDASCVCVASVVGCGKRKRRFVGWQLLLRTEYS